MNTAIKYLLFFILIISNFVLPQNEAMKAADKFAQLKEELPTPNTYRVASGAPGHEYWQQRADYKIDVVLDDENLVLGGDLDQPLPPLKRQGRAGRIVEIGQHVDELDRLPRQHLIQDVHLHPIVIQGNGHISGPVRVPRLQRPQVGGRTG